MKKRLSLVSSLLVAGFGINAQVSIEKAKDIAVPASIEETIKWDKYGANGGAKNASTLSTLNFGSRATSSAGTVIGSSQYDLMTNSSIDNRFFNNGDGTFSAAFTWSDQADPYLNRGTGYLYNNGTSWNIKNPTGRVESERNGWPSIMTTGNGDEIIISHSTASDQLLLSKRSTKGTGAWTEVKDPTGSQVAPKVGSGYLIWPRACVGGPNNNTVHLIALTEPVPAQGGAFNGVIVGGMDGALVYSRSDDGGATWAVKNVILPGINGNVYSGINADSYAITANGNNVAIAVFHRFGDTRVLKSTDNGRSWSTHIPLDFEHDAFEFEDFAILDTPTTADNTGDILIDNNGEVHLFFGTWRWNDADITDQSYSTFPLANGLGYWKESYGDNNWKQLFGYQDVNGDGLIGIVGYPNNFDGFTNYGAKSIVSFPSVGMNSSGDIFLKFTNLMEDASATGGKLYNNGSRHFRHEWVTRSNDGGCTWSNPVDLTDAGAGFEECVYGVVPKAIDGKFRMIYMEDGSPGTAVGPEAHAGTTNEMVYLEVAATTISASKDICMTGIAGTRELCGGDTATLDAGISCGTAYVWKDASGNTLGTNATTVVTAPGIYTCDITTACGVQQETIEIKTPQSGNGPKVSVTSSVSELCASGSQATLKVTYSSFGSSGSIIWDQGIPGTVDTFNITSPGTYTVEVANCGGSTVDTIVVDTVKDVNAIITGKQFLCPGETSTLTVPINPDGTYTWKDGAGTTIGTTRSVSVNATGTYTVDVTACGGTLTGSNMINVNAEPSPTATIALVNGSVVDNCLDPDGSVDLQATGQTGATFKWSNGSTGSLISIPTAPVGSTVVSVMSFNACNDSVKSNEITVNVLAAPAGPTITESNYVLTSSSSNGVKWYYDDPRTAGGWVFTGETGATYDVSTAKYPRGSKIGASVTDLTTGCESEVVDSKITTEVSSIEAIGSGISIYPNPNTGEFNVNFEGITSSVDVNVKISNNVGQVVYESVLNLTSNHSETVNLNGLDKGVYFMNVTKNNEKTTHRIVVQ